VKNYFKDPQGMHVSETGLTFIQEMEGLQLRPYQDSANNWTVGYGHLITDRKHMRQITREEARKFLAIDIRVAEDDIHHTITAHLTQNQFDALASLFYNLGRTQLKDSDLVHYVNHSQFTEAAMEWPRWSRAKGRFIPGLFMRRCKEAFLFIGLPDRGK